MPSVKSKMFNFLMRNRHLLQGTFKREVFDFNTSIEGFREQCEKSASKHAKIPDGIEIKNENINGIKSEWIIPEGADINKVILYVHGGGYVSGSCNDHRGFVSKFAKNCGVITLQYEYRLSPEHPFPDGLNDSVAVYKWLLDEGFIPSNIIIAGESAGGGLALAMLLALKEQNISMPAATVAISPWTDLTCSSGSYKTKNKVSVAPMNSWAVFSKYYTRDNPPDLPLISPLFGDLQGLPPIYINSGEDDELFEDGERFFLKAKKAGVDITFSAGKGMVHYYPLLAPIFKEATDAMQEICTFVNKQI
ncbi:alpha/beta hydrolase [Chloroflexota bacterium]